MLRSLTIVFCLVAGGCVSHVARALPPVDQSASAAVGSRIVDRFDEPIEERGSLPRSLPVTVWRLDPDGNLARGDSVIETPLPWWQRFPADAISDVMLPRTLTAAASGTPHMHPVPAGDALVLAEHARAAGYAAPAAEAHHP